jgi:hypothetical protein
MLLKSLVVSVAAALLGPTLGIATFLAVNGAYPNQPLAASSQIADETAQPTPLALMAFAPSGPWYGNVQERELGTATADISPEASGWQTVVSCPDGQTLSGDARCQTSKRPQT